MDVLLPALKEAEFLKPSFSISLFTKTNGSKKWSQSSTRDGLRIYKQDTHDSGNSVNEVD